MTGHSCVRSTPQQRLAWRHARLAGLLTIHELDLRRAIGFDVGRSRVVALGLLGAQQEAIIVAIIVSDAAGARRAISLGLAACETAIPALEWQAHERHLPREAIRVGHASGPHPVPLRGREVIIITIARCDGTQDSYEQNGLTKRTVHPAMLSAPTATQPILANGRCRACAARHILRASANQRSRLKPCRVRQPGLPSAANRPSTVLR